MYLASHEESDLGWVQAAIAAGTTIVGAVQQNKAIKGQIKTGKQALQLEQERRLTLQQEGAQLLQHDRTKIIMLGVGSLAALGIGYMVMNRKRR